MRSLVCIGIVYTMVSDVASCSIDGVVLMVAVYFDGFLDTCRTFLILDGLPAISWTDIMKTVFGSDFFSSRVDAHVGLIDEYSHV